MKEWRNGMYNPLKDKMGIQKRRKESLFSFLEWRRNTIFPEQRRKGAVKEEKEEEEEQGSEPETIEPPGKNRGEEPSEEEAVEEEQQVIMHVQRAAVQNEAQPGMYCPRRRHQERRKGIEKPYWRKCRLWTPHHTKPDQGTMATTCLLVMWNTIVVKDPHTMWGLRRRKSKMRWSQVLIRER